MAKSLTQEVKDCYKRCVERIEMAKPEHKEAVKKTSKGRLQGFMHAVNMKRWQGRKCMAMIWDMFEAIDKM